MSLLQHPIFSEALGPFGWVFMFIGGYFFL